MRSRSCHSMGLGRNPCTQFLHRPRFHQPRLGQWVGTCSTPGSFETCMNVAAPGLGDRSPLSHLQNHYYFYLTQDLVKACLAVYVFIHSFIHSTGFFFFNQCQVICILFLTRTIKYFLPRAFLRTADVVISVPLKHQRPLLRKRTGESRTLRPLIYCASALRLPPIRRAQAHFRRLSASPPPWNPPQCASAQHLRFPPLSPSPPPSFPLQEAGSGARSPL